MEAFFQEISEHIAKTYAEAGCTNNSINLVEIEVFRALSAKCFDLLASRDYSEILEISSYTITRLHNELGPYYSWDTPTKKGVGFCLAWYHIFEAMAWGSREKGEFSINHLEQALLVKDLPVHTKSFATNMKNEIAVIVEAEKRKAMLAQTKSKEKKGLLSKLFG